MVASGRWSVVLRHLGRAFDGGTVAGLGEGQLLDRFLVDRDEDAFEGLIARHGPMVLGVCRSILADPDDVEDAFQATFLVLVRRARGLKDRDALAPWLFGVARKVARRARADGSRRRARERPERGADRIAIGPEDFDLRERRGLVRDEVARLPDAERSAVVLCFLEGLTHEEAAARLGWPIGTVKGRLARAKGRLADRLGRRGVAMAIPALLALLADDASAHVPAHLIRSSCLAATRLATGRTLAAGVASTRALALTEGVLRTMTLSPWKTLVLLVASAGTVAVPPLLAGQYQVPAAKGPDLAAPDLAAPAGPIPPIATGPPRGRVESKKDAEAKPAEDPAALKSTEPRPAAGPMEPAAAARLANAALRQLETRLRGRTGVLPNGGFVAEYARWSLRLADAEGTTPEKREAALAGHLGRMKAMLGMMRAANRSDNALATDVLEAIFQVEQAGRASGDRPAEPKPAVEPVAPANAVRPVRASTPPGKRSLAIYRKLVEPFALRFPEPTPLRDVLRAISKGTVDAEAGLPDGIPFYVDPSPNPTYTSMSRDVSIDVAELPLSTALELIVKQVARGYLVKDGMVLIAQPNELNSIQPDPTVAGDGPPMGSGMGQPRFVINPESPDEPDNSATSYRASKAETPADLERDKAIRDRLRRPITVHFGGEKGTPLHEAVARIEELIRGPGEGPMPVYIQPQGLQDADITPDVPIKIDLEDVPARTVLRLILAQRSLIYLIDEGVLVVASGNPGAMARQDREDRSPDGAARDARVVALLEREWPIKFAEPTPLRAVLTSLAKQVREDGGRPLPLYVDTTDIEDFEKTMGAPIILDLEGLPLRTTLRLILAQAGLRCQVKDGLLVIEFDDTEKKAAEERQKRQDQLVPPGQGGMGGGGFR